MLVGHNIALVTSPRPAQAGRDGLFDKFLEAGVVNLAILDLLGNLRRLNGGGHTLDDRVQNGQASARRWDARTSRANRTDAPGS